MRIAKLLRYSAFRLSVVKPKPKKSQRPIRRKKNTSQSQQELKVQPTKSPKARENAGDQVEIGFSFASDWLREQREFFRPITERRKQKQTIPDYVRHFIVNCTKSLTLLNFSLNSGEKAWWTREFNREYLPFVVNNSSLSTLEDMLEKKRIYRVKSQKARDKFGAILFFRFPRPQQKQLKISGGPHIKNKI